MDDIEGKLIYESMYEENEENGGSTPSQYYFPNGAKEIQDLIEFRKMSFGIGNIFKAAYRIGTKNDELYEINKIIWFAERRKAELMKGIE